MDSQLQGINASLQKARRKLDELQTSLRPRHEGRIKGGQSPTTQTVLLGWSPMFHWTDSRIRVRAFFCVAALTLTSLLQRALHQKGLDWSV